METNTDHDQNLLTFHFLDAREDVAAAVPSLCTSSIIPK